MPYIVSSSSTKCIVGVLLTDIDSDKINHIVTQFFQQNYSSFNIVSTTLENDAWYVKGFVTLFGQQLSRILTIDCKTGKILKCE